MHQHSVSDKASPNLTRVQGSGKRGHIHGFGGTNDAPESAAPAAAMELELAIEVATCEKATML